MKTIDIELTDEAFKKLNDRQPNTDVELWLFALRERAANDRIQYRLIYQGEAMKTIGRCFG